MLLINRILFFVEKKGKPATAVEIKVTRSACNQTINVKIDKWERNISVTSPECPFRLYYDDLKSLLPQSMVLGQVLNSLLRAISLELFKDGKKVFILPESFFPRAHTDKSWEKSIPGGNDDIEYIVALSFYNRPWFMPQKSWNIIWTHFLDMFRIRRSNKT